MKPELGPLSVSNSFECPDEELLTTTTTSTSSSRSSVFDRYSDLEVIQEPSKDHSKLNGLEILLDRASNGLALVQPNNFGTVMAGVYRSAFPQPENLPFLETLSLKTILTLVTEPYTTTHNEFVIQHCIKHVRIEVQANKNPFLVISQCTMAAALGVIMDKANHPILIHCNKGKHRTGTTVGCLRKVLGWEMEDISKEYRHFAGAKSRELDERFMDLFDERALLWLAKHNGLLPQDPPIKGSVTPGPSVLLLLAFVFEVLLGWANKLRCGLLRLLRGT